VSEQRSRDWSTLGALVGALAAANILRSTIVPDDLHLVFNLATGGAAFALGHRAGLTRDELGLGRGPWRRGAAHGAVAAAAVLPAFAASPICT
jgi:hypothetical protein